MSVEKSMKYLIRKARFAKSFGDHGLMHIYNAVEIVAGNMLHIAEFDAGGEISAEEYDAEEERTIDLLKILESYIKSYMLEKNSDFC